MFKKILIITCFFVPGSFAFSQSTGKDTIPQRNADDLIIDSTDYEDLLNDLDLFLDSILTPRSYVLLNLSAGQGYFNFTNKTNARIKQVKKFIWSPTLGYYDKNGLGITITGYTIYDSAKRYFYQASLTPSYDYLRNRDLATGISYSRYFTRNALPFYTSPLQSELNGYFLWRKSWLQPGVAASYGWGSHTEFNKREILYRRLLAAAAAEGAINIPDTVSILTRNRQSIVDFSLTFSLRHDFYWLDIFSKKDHIRISPLLSVASGTQKFGFNQSNTAFGNLRAVALNNTRSVSLQEKFQLLSMTLYLRGEYSFGKFFMQPQLLFDYYFPGENDHVTTLFSLNAGFMF
jgi:hypothetical protein